MSDFSNVLEQLFDAVPVGLAVVDRDLRYVRINRFLAAFAEKSAEEHIGRKVAEVASPLSAEIRQACQRVLAGGESVVGVDFPGGPESASWRFQADYHPLKEADGGVAAVMVVCRDNAERRRMEDALRASEERYRTIFTHSPIGVELYDADGRQLTINPAAMHIFGVSDPADIAAFNLFDGTSLTEEMKERLRRGEPVDYETAYDFDWVRELGQYRTSRSGTAFLKYSIAPLSDAETGAVSGYLLHVGDISVPRSAQLAFQRRAALDGLIAAEVARLATAGTAEIDDCVRASLEEIARFLGAGNAYVVQASADGATWSCTHEWCAPGVPSYRDDFQDVPLGTHAWLENEILAGRVVEVRQLDDLPPEAQASRRLFEREGRKSYFLVPILEHDRRFDGCVGFSHFAAGAGWTPEDIAGVQLAGTVITHALARRRAELQAQQLREQLLHVARVSTLGEFTAALAHELNQPLAAARAYAEGSLELLRNGATATHRIVPALQGIVAEMARAGEVIRRLRNLVKRRPARRAATDLNRLIQEVVWIVAPGLRQRDVSLDVRLASGLPPVSADAVQLQQVLLNLVQNGVDAVTARDGRRKIVIASRAAGDLCAVEVEDSGPGIPAAVRQHVFEPYFSTKSEGLGLGLTISRTIVEAHGGQLEIDAGRAEGCLVRMTLPRSAGGQ